MEDWLKHTAAYIPTWIDYQLRCSEQVGCLLAIVHEGKLVLEYAAGSANLAGAEPLTPRHRFRIASHSKSFTAAGLMLLREQGRLKLDDTIGAFIPGLHDDVAHATLAQVMSHSAGLTRDGNAGNQFAGLRPFADKAELLADLSKPPILERNTRFKYSNHGFALLGLVIEAITYEPYAAWIRRQVVAPFGLTETEPDMPLPPGTPFARGHTGKTLLGRRQIVPGDYTLNALTPAGGFVSTAADVARFFAQLSPKAAASPLSADSRREMTRGQWKSPHSTVATTYGLGTFSGALSDWDWFGHSGGLLGYVSRTAVVPDRNLAISVLTNASDGLAWPWLDGMLHVARALAERGEPTEEVRGWTGRWWAAGGAIDLLPAGNRVLVAVPGFLNPVMDATEIEVTGPDEGRVALGAGYDNHGEPVRLVRDETGTPIEFWAQGIRFAPEPVVAKEIRDLYGLPVGPLTQLESSGQSPSQ
jgi:CubicO group peptidase (beta-lactamase class C family)